jgi:hypothetical protein
LAGAIETFAVSLERGSRTRKLNRTTTGLTTDLNIFRCDLYRLFAINRFVEIKTDGAVLSGLF